MRHKFVTPVVVSFGEESFFLDRDFNSFRDQPKALVTVFDGEEVSESDVISECETFQVDFEDPSNIRPRVIVVDNAHKFKPGKLTKNYVDNRAPSDTSSVLALIDRSNKCPVFWTKLGSKVTIREHKKLKTWESNNEVVKWLQTEATRIGLNLDRRVALAMYQVSGDNLYVLFSELKKLKLLVEPKQPVEIKHLQLIMTPASTVAPWDVADAAFGKNKCKALNILSSLYKFSTDDPSLQILGALMKSAERLIVARSMLDKGAETEEISTRLGIHPYRYQMALQPQVEKQTTLGLMQTMQILSKLDVELKRTSHRRTLVELTVLNLAT
jgi:DNA polymerase III delta subunit